MKCGGVFKLNTKVFKPATKSCREKGGDFYAFLYGRIIVPINLEDFFLFVFLGFFQVIVGLQAKPKAGGVAEKGA